MHIVSLNLTRRGYCESIAEDFICSIKVKGQYSTTDLILPKTLSDQVISVIAEMIVEAGRDMANSLTVEAFEAKALSSTTKPVPMIGTSDGDEVLS